MPHQHVDRKQSVITLISQACSMEIETSRVTFDPIDLPTKPVIVFSLKRYVEYSMHITLLLSFFHLPFVEFSFDHNFDLECSLRTVKLYSM